MSFWGFGGKKKADDLPSAEASGQQCSNPDKEDSRSQDVPAIASGPPPTANTYIHAQARPSIPNPSNVQHNANPPGFQIFLPKQEGGIPKSEAEENDGVGKEDKAGLNETEAGVENLVVDSNHRDENNEVDDELESRSEKQICDKTFGQLDKASEQESIIQPRESLQNTLIGEELVTNVETNQREQHSHCSEKKEAENTEKETIIGEETVEEVSSTNESNPLQEGESPAKCPTALEKFVSPLKQNRFNFLTEAPMAIPKLQESKTKRRYEYNTQVHEMNCSFAGLQARMAKESMDRDKELRQVLPSVCRRLDNISDQFMGSKFMLDEERTKILNIQKRLAAVHTKSLQYKHDTLNQIQFDEFESIHVDLIENIKPSIMIEAAKTDKRELALFRKFESFAGTQTRRFVEETSTRVAASRLLEDHMKIEGLEEKTGFLEQIRQLRKKIKEERESRQVNDAKVLQEVHKRCAALQRAVLEAAGDQFE
mmetsp:Transcript_7617/g.11636  ORF Transcript_7617/g.11636 Transcript_7617/m.11636 type:complete len:484 (+) Transcript_7617:77-1528(+)|eukprot:CAMPEP_0178906640 /NCGR_PEP_ID=MMETSP0786-20121207/6936_1 /TAXON_ID=186022 /ORGANISM="Thalassionema frauenfeldii, Strain CCMP 1798" /LENGTH=483 /DNA_ID=CAMNT_0020578367 /DNA_START=20 /DNA_END=1471 /DNA_ORIENTATION=+